MIQNFGYITENAASSRFDNIQSELDEHIKQFDKLSEMYIEYTYGNSQQVQQLEDNLIKYATALSRNLVAVRSMIATLKQTDTNIQEEIDTKFASIDDSLDKISHMIEDLQVQTVKRDDYPGSDINRKYNSIVRIGNIRIPAEKKFSKFAKWLWEKLLGIKIVDIAKADTIVIHKTGFSSDIDELANMLDAGVKIDKEDT